MKEKLVQLIKKSKKNEKGFTLIEMIVVIAIIGVLAAILVPSMSGYISNSKDAQKEANARTLFTSAQAAATTHASDITGEIKFTIEKDASKATVSGTDKLSTNQKIANEIIDLMGGDGKIKAKCIVNINGQGAVTGVSYDSVVYPEGVAVSES